LPRKQNNEPGITNLILNITIFVLAAIVIYLLFVFFVNVSGGTANNERQNTVKEDFKPNEIIQAEVLNGCGISGIADIFKDYLRAKNVDVVSTGNYINFDVRNSFIIDRIGNKKKTLYIANLLGIDKKNVITRINRDYFLDLTIVLGKDYLSLKPLR